MHANGPAIRPIGRPATHQPKLETINMRTSVPGAFLDSVLRGALEAKAGTTRPTTVIAIGNLATSILEHCDTPRGLARQLRQSLTSCQNHCYRWQPSLRGWPSRAARHTLYWSLL